jgi:PHS family inorganic phosphate transporter-like MFS transporter
VLIGFSFAMALGALFAWAWIPEVQNPRGSDADDVNGRGGGGRSGRGGGRKSKKRRALRRYEVPSKSLEELARGRAAVKDDELRVGFRHRGELVVNRMRRPVRRSTAATA